MTKTIAIAAAANFFRTRWIGSRAMLPTFLANVRAYLAAASERVTLYVDYDPLDDLLALIRQSGIECSGCLFSARKLFDGGKFGIFFDPIRKTVEFKLGYGHRGNPIHWTD